MRQSTVKFIAKTAALSTAIAGVMLLSGCSKKEESLTLNIAFQTYSVLPIVKARCTSGTLLTQQCVNVKWV